MQKWNREQFIRQSVVIVIVFCAEIVIHLPLKQLYLPKLDRNRVRTIAILIDKLRFHYLLPIALFGSISLVSYISPAAALSPEEIQRIAKQTTVQITGCDFGSGAIIRKDGNTYTVLTVAHAVKNTGCEVTTPDDTKYQIAQVKTFPDKVDLAVFTFTSNKNYPVAKLINNSDRIEALETIYVSGFPLSTAINSSVFTIVRGDVVANPPTKQQGKGYSLIYSNNTLPGHSGGPVWNDKGEVIAIHGQGDVDTKLQETVNANVRVKTGYNLGITVNTFTKLATAAGVRACKEITSCILKRLLTGMKEVIPLWTNPAMGQIHSCHLSI
jgi:hypothetical protein